MMLAYRLVRLIEAHSDALASSLLRKVQESDCTRNYSNVPHEELKLRVHEIYQHLGEWLLEKKDVDVERHYREIGARRYHQKVPLTEVIWSIAMTKENLWEFLSRETIQDRPVELFGELEVLQLLGHFFDRAIYYVAVGYEEARAGKQAVPGSFAARAAHN